MKRILYTFIVITMVCTLLQGCKSNKTENIITKEMAYEGVYNYCHSEYDWTNSSIMYVEMGYENDTEYQVIFRSYTGSFVHFYVDKTSGITKMMDYNPTLGINSESGTINLYDYINND